MTIKSTHANSSAFDPGVPIEPGRLILAAKLDARDVAEFHGAGIKDRERAGLAGIDAGDNQIRMGSRHRSFLSV
jgi:hypothetical protein